MSRSRRHSRCSVTRSSFRRASWPRGRGTRPRGSRESPVARTPSGARGTASALLRQNQPTATVTWLKRRHQNLVAFFKSFHNQNARSCFFLYTFYKNTCAVDYFIGFRAYLRVIGVSSGCYRRRNDVGGCLGLAVSRVPVNASTWPHCA